MEALKARIRELEKQILRGDRYKCLICMVSIKRYKDFIRLSALKALKPESAMYKTSKLSSAVVEGTGRLCLG